MPRRYLAYGTSPGGDGSRRRPWAKWNEVNWERGLELVVSGSAVPNFPYTTVVKGIDNIRIIRDVDSPRPVCTSYQKFTNPDDWVEIDPMDGVTPVGRPGSSNVWRNTRVKGRVTWMAFGELDALSGFVNEQTIHRFGNGQDYQRQHYFRGGRLYQPRLNRPKRYGQWDSLEERGVYVYSEGNPISSRYYGGNVWFQVWQSVVRFVDCNGISVSGLGFRHGVELLKISNSSANTTIRDFHVNDISGGFSQYLVDLNGGRTLGQGQDRAYLDNVLIENIEARYIGETFIRLNSWFKNAEVRNCRASLCGVLQSSAAFYIGNLYIPSGYRMRVHDLDLSHWGFGARWSIDGAAVYIDSSNFNPYEPGPAHDHGAFCDFYDLHCRHGKYGAIFNAGQRGIRLYRNVFHDTETLIDVRDAVQIGQTEIECANNTLIAAQPGRYTVDPLVDQVAAIRIRPERFKGTLRARNNIVVGNGASDYLGMVDRSTTDNRRSRLVDSNNQVYACASMKTNRPGRPMIADRSNDASDPRLFDAARGDIRLRATSPCIDSGETIPGITEVDGRGVFQNGKPDRGARYFTPKGAPERFGDEISEPRAMFSQDLGKDDA